MDITLILADTLSIIVERVDTSGELSIQRIEGEIERISAERPWYKNNLQKAGVLGLEASEILQLGIESVRSIDESQ